ncbi:hypothetical protein LEP1GSC145_1528 [Leptospira interrogans serovar Djasiman str. LT1649]|nr:hypothetical protein LEP1GSC045_4266 [Leptospira interrogans serovar Pomona str. Kennewicki LC82-25]EKO95870.1 hypothetical protein LEP1GSC057_1013 [Leptospira interrogans str. Brem 329]EMF71828.1 hypothetical protein LEP1GSC148_4459 [Leptospira interrogans serovar Canicola str. LT1962]EMI66052.1 hypothetical protein LEP1GSC200_1776 [Leptospira interrogans serovar Pomona str. CSL10083]EMM92191.1 hypothetical protein LEP1GSC145_1528 [Leptospira interrogans serovar Djasiman str. LT1649]EMN380
MENQNGSVGTRLPLKNLFNRQLYSVMIYTFSFLTVNSNFSKSL